MKNYSGAAQGADNYWKVLGKEYGVETVDYTTDTMDILNLEQRKEVEVAYYKVFKQINRSYLHPGSYAGKLVRRNYLQAKAGDEIFAIGNLVQGKVDGGTAYCVQYAIDMNKPIYFYDQVTNQWVKWDYIIHNWERCDCPYLGIKNTTVGTRKLTPEGMQAIEEVYSKTFNTK